MPEFNTRPWGVYCNIVTPNNKPMLMKTKRNWNIAGGTRERFKVIVFPLKMVIAHGNPNPKQMLIT